MEGARRTGLSEPGAPHSEERQFPPMVLRPLATSAFPDAVSAAVGLGGTRTVLVATGRRLVALKLVWQRPRRPGLGSGGRVGEAQDMTTTAAASATMPAGSALTAWEEGRDAPNTQAAGSEGVAAVAGPSSWTGASAPTSIRCPAPPAISRPREGGATWKMVRVAWVWLSSPAVALTAAPYRRVGSSLKGDDCHACRHVTVSHVGGHVTLFEVVGHLAGGPLLRVRAQRGRLLCINPKE